MRPGYAIEYDFVYPTQIKHTLEVKGIEGLYLAGQIMVHRDMKRQQHRD